MNDWIILIGIGLVGLPLIIIGFVAMWRERQMGKIDK